MKTCARCGEIKEEDEFNWRYFGIKRQSICRECQRLARREHYERHTEKEKERTYEITKKRRDEAMYFIYDYLSYSICADCRTNNFEVLTFDHVRGKKKMDIMQMAQQGYAIEAIKREILKCDIVCFNCHMMREYRRRTGKGRFGKFWPKFPWENDE